ncbi:MAG: hypothetical protein U0414_21960 [Polyangiaceae bacterium]
MSHKQLALMLVASERSVSAREVLSVFPPAIGDVAKLRSFSPDQLRDAMHKHDSSHAFRVASGVGFDG